MADRPALRLDGYLPYRLSVLSNAVSSRIARIYEEEFHLSVWQWRVIAVLGESPGLTSTEVSTRTLMDKPTVSRAAASLLERDLISRTTDLEDRRRAPLMLTEHGRQIYDAIIPRAVACEKELLDVLTAGDEATLHVLLTRLAGVVSPDRPLWNDEGA